MRSEYDKRRRAELLEQRREYAKLFYNGLSYSSFLCGHIRDVLYRKHGIPPISTAECREIRDVLRYEDLIEHIGGGMYQKVRPEFRFKRRVLWGGLVVDPKDIKKKLAKQMK